MARSEVVLIGSDHNGFREKDFLIAHIQDEGLIPIDLGPYSAAKADYDVIANQMGNIVNQREQCGDEVCGVLICGTGVGMSIAANRFPSVRASLVHSVDVAVKTREHNDSNVLCLGSWKSSKEEMVEIFDAWYDQEFGGGRHEPRVARLGKSDRLVAVPGVFDTLQPVHLDVLEFAKNFGRVCVLLNTDEHARKMHGVRPMQTYASRERIIKSVSQVDEVIPNDGDVPILLRQLGADVLVKGYGSEEEIRRVDGVGSDVQVKILRGDGA